ncbi:MAG TPA: hypothetical protein VGK93_09215 [Candidatus Eisenbacteria bacterium]
MATAPTPESRRRLVLVDFDWQDADLVPDLLKQPGVSIRLVAGSSADDAGMRLAELCGLPRTTDLADLTREIFDLALVSERSPRRSQVEDLLRALGTPCVTPQSFAWSEPVEDLVAKGPDSSLPLDTATDGLDSGGPDLDEVLEQALPDLAEEPPAPPPTPTVESPRIEPEPEDLPTLEDRDGLEAALRRLMSSTGATTAELRLGNVESMDRVVGIGAEDLLLNGLVELARRTGAPQVVGDLTGAGEGKAWGAWPFRTAQHGGVVAAGGIVPGTGWTEWQRRVDELRDGWGRQDRERIGVTFPLVPDSKSGWLEVQEFSMRLELARERNRRDGLRFALHRLDFPGSTPAVDRLSKDLPRRLRDTDSICRPTSHRMLLLLAAGGRDRFPSLRRRITQSWQKAWLEEGNERPVPGITEERIDLTKTGDTDRFMAKAATWLTDLS